jgi:peptide deformylase
MEIRIYPDPVLRRTAEPVTEFDEGVARLAADMAETMYAAPGVGLAAPQVGVGKRLFVIDLASPQREDLLVLVNPAIVRREGEIVWEEGCLSFPDVRTEVQRSRIVEMKAQDVKGNHFTIEGEDLLAVALQHELDHLQGRLLIDNMPLVDRTLLKRKLTRQAVAEAKPG